MTGNYEDKRISNRKRACMLEYGNSLVCVDPSLAILELIGKKYTIMIIGVIGNRRTERTGWCSGCQGIP